MTQLKPVEIPLQVMLPYTLVKLHDGAYKASVIYMIYMIHDFKKDTSAPFQYIVHSTVYKLPMILHLLKTFVDKLSFDSSIKLQKP